MRIRLREIPGAPVLGTNMHVLGGHARLAFVEEHYKAGKVLDVGCGQGAFSLHLHRLDCDVVMMDVLPVTAPEEGITVRQASVLELEEEGLYDTVLLMEVIEHLIEPEDAIARSYDALKPGGRLLITTPHVPDWDSAPDHVWRFDEESVVDLLEPYCAEVWQDATFVYAVVVSLRDPK